MTTESTRPAAVGPSAPHPPGGSGGAASSVPETLRDYFAAAALTGLLANSFSDGYHQPISLANAEEIASMAWAQADVMLAKRDKP